MWKTISIKIMKYLRNLIKKRFGIKKSIKINKMVDAIITPNLYDRK